MSAFALELKLYSALLVSLALFKLVLRNDMPRFYILADMLLLKSYIGVARNETGSSRFPKIAFKKFSALGLVACNSTKKSKCSEQIRKSWETYKTFLGLVHKFISYDKAIDGLVKTGAAHSWSFRVDIPYFF